MKDIVIISIYDLGYGGFSVMVDGVVYGQRVFDNEKETVADALYDVYKEFGSEKSEEEFKKMFPDKQVIICEDGCINVL